jgi:hypothetical protein
MRQGIAACRGIADVLSEEAFLLILDEAITCQSTQIGRENTNTLASAFPVRESRGTIFTF